MAKTCKKCAKQYDDKLQACPHCGYMTPVKKGAPLWIRVVGTVAAVVAIFVAILFGSGVITPENGYQPQQREPSGTTRVPDLYNLSAEEAQARLEEANLLCAIVGKQYSSTVREGYVLEQNLSADTVVPVNSYVNLTLSAGKRIAQVPDVLNLEYEVAAMVLETEGFKVVKEEQYSSVIQRGMVISQSHDTSNKLEIGSVITLVVSIGSDPNDQTLHQSFQMPNLVGMDYDEVLETAERYGFRIYISDRVYSDRYEKNQVVSQDPGNGTTVTTGTMVSIVISQGRQQIQLPDVQYHDVQEATQQLETLGLKVQIRETASDTVAEGLVMFQSPASGNYLDPGATVELVVSSGPAAFEMPDVVGMTEDQARSALTAKGLAVSVSYEYSTKDSGTVLSQSIPEGDSVTRGTTVSLTVSSGQKTIRVPDVTGMNKTAAENTLRDKGFTVSVNSVYSDDVAENLVISQTPGKEASLTEGSTVAIMVSLGKDTVVSLAVSNQPTKTTYEKGEILNTAGLKLKVNYKSGRTEIITSGFTCSPAKLSTTGTQTITVNYGGKSTTFTVVVRDVSVSTISVKTKPNKLTYYKGDTLNTAGLVLNVTYSNGTTDTITSGFTCSPTTLNTVGTQTITVSYGGKFTTFTVKVENVLISSISIKTKPNKVTYYKGDTLNTAGLSLTVQNSNGSTSTVTSGFTCSPTKLSTTGTQTITVTYNGKTTTFTVKVEDVTVSSISVKTKPSKVTYNKDDTLNTAGLVLNVTYSNDTTTTVSSGFTCSPTKLSTTGTQTITVTYGGKTTTFTVTVNPLSVKSISVKTKPSKVNYSVGDTLNTAGLVLNVTYSNDTTGTVSTGFTCSPASLTKSGTQTITVTYGGKTTTFTVNVAALTVQSVSIKTKPNKTTYYVGDMLDNTGLTLTVKYTDGSTKTISSGYTCSITTLNVQGTQTVSITYGGKSATFTVTVKPATLVSIAIKTKPNKTTYYVGDRLVTTGLSLTATYSNGTTKTIYSDFTCSPALLNTAGTQTVTVTYEGKTATFTVTVLASRQAPSPVQADVPKGTPLS